MIENIKFENIKWLIGLVKSSKDNIEGFIKKQYDTSYENYESICNFLLGLGILVRDNNGLGLDNRINAVLDEVDDDEGLKEYLLSLMLNSNTRSDVEDYLENYKVTNGQFCYKPNTANRLRESDIRDLFMELGLVQYDAPLKTYFIRDEQYDTFIMYLNRKELSLTEFEAIQNRKSEIGRMAELAVIEYEKTRLALHPELLNKIKHVAERNVRAGYDILSWESFEEEEPIPRYIEVKAVSLHDFSFYWTRNEILKAEKFSDSYFLYLVPITHGQVDMEQLNVICNPVNGVFNEESWSKEVEVYVISKGNRSIK